MKKRSAKRSKSTVYQEKTANKDVSQPKSVKLNSSKKVADAAEYSSSSDSDFVSSKCAKSVKTANKRMNETHTEDVSHKSKKRRTEDVSKVVDKSVKSKKSKRSPKKGDIVKQRTQKLKVDVLPSVRIRCSPNLLFEVLSNMKEPQKSVIREMGFGSFLDMKLDILPGSLGFFVVENLDVDGLKITFDSGSININREAVRDILGIPMGDVNLLSLPLKIVDDGEVAYSNRWKSGFGVDNVRAKHVADLLIHSNEAGLSFKLNFLMLFVGTMITLDGSGAYTVGFQREILDHIADDTDIKSIDWCGFLIRHMKGCKKRWPLPRETHWSGPMTFLQLLYVDSTLCQSFPVSRSRPAIKYWNRIYLSERVEAEVKANGNFGKLPLQPPFSEDEVDQGVNVLATACASVDSSLEEIYSKVQEIALQLDSTLNRGVSLFPDDVKLLGLKDKFEEFLRHSKTEIPTVVDQRFNDDVRDPCDDADGGNVECNEEACNHQNSDGFCENLKNTDGDVFDNQKDVLDGTNFEKSKDIDDKQHDANCAGEDDGLNGDQWLNDSALIAVLEKIDKSVPKTKVGRCATDYAPSFSLNLTQDFITPSPKPINRIVTRSSPASGSANVVLSIKDDADPKNAKLKDVKKRKVKASKGCDDAKNANLEDANKRMSKPSKYFLSPYKGIVTNVTTSLEQSEFELAGSFFVLQGEAGEFVFETKTGHYLTRANLESLAPGVSVHSSVIDVWSLILLEEQMVKGGTPSRLFLYSTTITSGMWDGTLTFEKAFEIFESNVEVVLRGNPEFLDMKNFETVFFPILAFEHYYLVVFNLARAAFTIIDNSASCDEYDVKYKQVCDVVRDLFVCHLRKYGHPKADNIKKVKHNIMKMKWRTKNNKSDCGVFLMCHMDTYVGQAREDWDIGFKRESARGDVTQKIQLTNLRAKYCTKILCYSKNILKHKIDGYLKAFKEEYVVPMGKEAIRKAVASNMHFDRL